MSGRRDDPSGGSWRDDRAWQAGIVIGSALGAAATVVGRWMERRARAGLVDWAAVERIAVARIAAAPGRLSAADLRATERKVVAVWEAIRRAEETGDWQASPSRLCDWCAHQAICPAYGGTPPPLPVVPPPDLASG